MGTSTYFLPFGMFGIGLTELLVLGITIGIWMVIISGAIKLSQFMFERDASTGFPKLLPIRSIESLKTMNLPPPLDRLKTIFRGLLIAEISLTLILIPISLGYGMMLEAQSQGEATADLPAAEIVGMAVVLVFGLIFFIVYLAALIAAWVGLFQYRPWARWLYLGTQAAGCLLSLLFGLFDFSFQWGLISSLDSVIYVLVGCNISLLLFSELSRAFDTPAKDSPIVVATAADLT